MWLSMSVGDTGVIDVNQSVRAWAPRPRLNWLGRLHRGIAVMSVWAFLAGTFFGWLRLRLSV
jgi:hypothetical protein